MTPKEIEKSISYAVGTLAFEGYELPEETKEIYRQCLADEITLDEAIEKIIYGVKKRRGLNIKRPQKGE